MCTNVKVTLLADTFEMSFHLISHLTSSFLHRVTSGYVQKQHILLKVHVSLEGKLRNTINEYNIEQENI